MKKSDITKTFLLYSKKVLNLILDCLWPQFCLGCQKEGIICCSTCLKKLKLLPANPLPWPTNNFSFTACYVCLNYENQLVKKLIKTYKYKYLKNLDDILVDFLYEQSKNIKLPTDTIITNVPLHKKKKKIRGFDQTELLAQKLANKLNLSYYPLLIRTKNTKSQTTLTKEERIKNVKNIFTINKKIAGKQSTTILLLDDLATTGASLESASHTLMQNGYQKIICLVLAKN